MTYSKNTENLRLLNNDMTVAKKNIVRKHTSAIHISNEISALERKVSNILLKHAFKDIIFADQHQISLKDLLIDIGWDNTNKTSQHFIESIKRLNATQVEWNILGKDKKRKWGVTTLLAGLEIKDGIVFYSYSKELRQWLGNPNIYAVLDLEYQKRLNSKYSLALWEYATEQLDSSKKEEGCTVNITLPQLKTLLGVLDENAEVIEYKRLNQKILKKAVQELNDKTDITITVSTVKAGRRISGVIFDIKRVIHAKQLELFDTSIDQEVDAIGIIKGNIEIEDTIGKGRKLKLEDAQIQRYIAEFGASKVLEVLNAVIEKVKNGIPIENIGGYIYHLLTHGVIVPVSSEELKPKLVEQENTKVQNDKKKLEDWIAKYIEQEQNLHRKALLMGCQNVIPAPLIKKGIDDKEFIIDSVEEKEGRAVIVTLRHTARYNGFESKIYTALQSSFKDIGYKKVDIYMNYPDSKGKPKKLDEY